MTVATKKSIQLAGLLLWRFGLVLAGATALYRISKLLLSFVDFPLQIEIGMGLIFSGVAIFAFSLVLERIQDMRTEGALSE